MATAVPVEDVRPATAEEWDAIWTSCDFATYFHSREWGEIWSAATEGKTRPDPRLVTFRDGKKALLPLAVRRRYFGLVSTTISSLAWTYGGWITSDGLNADHARSLQQWLTRNHSDLFWKINPFDPLAAALEVSSAEHDETQVLDLEGGFDRVLKGWSKGHRAAASQARRAGVTIRRADGVEDWRTYFAIYEASLRRWGEHTLLRYGWPLFEAMANASSPHIRLWLADHDGAAVAGALCFHAPRHVVYWHGAALEEHFPLRPVHLLIQEVLREACEGGTYRWFDFNPSGPLEGVRAFKHGFGPRTLVCPNLRVERGWLGLARRLQRRALKGRDGSHR